MKAILDQRRFDRVLKNIQRSFSTKNQVLVTSKSIQILLDLERARIKSQKNIDGSKYKSRKERDNSKKMLLHALDDEVLEKKLGIPSSVLEIMNPVLKIHHYGKTIQRGGSSIKYAKRDVLGMKKEYTKEVYKQFKDIILKEIYGNL